MPAKIDFNRQSLRLSGNDYSAEGSYFITLCSDQHYFHFGAIFNDQMILNETGRIAKDEWFKLPDRFPHIHLGPFCVMPNHIHGIINVTSPNPAPTEESNQDKKEKKEKVTLGNIVGAYKSLVMKKCLADHKAKYPEESEAPAFGKIWQRNYYEHIIRTQQSYANISAYILTNPQNWTKDKFYIKFQ